MWQSVIVAYKGWRCLSKGMGKLLKPRDAFKRRVSVRALRSAPHHLEMKGCEGSAVVRACCHSSGMQQLHTLALPKPLDCLN